MMIIPFMLLQTLFSPVLFAPLALSIEYELIGRCDPIRFSLSSSGADSLYVQDSWFIGVSGNSPTESDGGAILARQLSSVTVLSSIFVDCHVTSFDSTDGLGGACCFTDTRVAMSRCCGRQCHSISGQFVGLSVGVGASLNESTCFQCGDTSVDSDSTIYYLDSPTDFQYMNFTANSVAYHGAAFLDPGTNAGFTGSYLTVTANSGGTIVYSAASVRPTISDCNFVNNDAGTCIIYNEGIGYNVEHCIFIETISWVLYVSDTAVTEQFQVSDCAFSGALYTAVWLSATRNSANTETNSFAFAKVVADLCANVVTACPTLTSTPRPSPSETPRETPTSTPRPSLSETPAFNASRSFGQSGRMTAALVRLGWGQWKRRRMIIDMGFVVMFM
jgi:hypothetical protein